MEIIKLFEIPIYAMKQEDFQKKWDKEIKKYNIHSEEEYKQIERLFFPKNVWKYNQIIGYIIINLVQRVYGTDIEFEWYQSDKKRFFFNSQKKNYISNLSLLGFNFFIEDNDTNEKIKLEINEMLSELLKDKQFKYRYVDLSIFKTQIKYLDIMRIINDISKNKTIRLKEI